MLGERSRCGELPALHAGEDNLYPDSPVQANNQAQAFVTVAEDASVPETLERIGEGGRGLYGESGFQAQVIQNGPPQGAQEVTVLGGSEEELEEASGLIVEEISDIDGLTNVESDVTGGAPDVAVTVDSESAAESGVSPAQVSGSLGIFIGEGSRATLGETPVEIGASEDAVDSLEEVRALPIGPGATVEDVADVEEVESLSAVSCSDVEWAGTVRGRITAQDSNAVSVEAQRG